VRQRKEEDRLDQKRKTENLTSEKKKTEEEENKLEGRAGGKYKRSNHDALVSWQRKKQRKVHGNGESLVGDAIL